MGNKVRIKIEIRTDSREECMKVGTKIHYQLVGNKDYIDSNIVLNCTEDDNVVRVYIFEECKDIPSIKF